MTDAPDHAHTRHAEPNPDADPHPGPHLGPHPGPDPATLSAQEIASAVRSRTLRAVDVVTATLERIQRADPVLCAFIEVWGGEALERAGEVDARVGAGEGELLPLAGVPIGVKGRHGLRTAGPLLAAGCVAVGATSVPGPGTPWQTWGLGRYGRTVNPWRYDRTPGGSSAGSAAAVAAGLVPLATASDGAGSVRIPAAWCGIVGLKVTNGRLPSADRTGLMAPGVLARSVGDAAAYWAVMSRAHRETLRPNRSDGPGRPDRSDRPDNSDRPDDNDGPDYSKGAGTADRPPGEHDTPAAAWSPDLGFDTPDPAIVAVAHSAAVRLAEAGALRLAPPATPLHLDNPAPAWLALRTPGADPAPAHRIRAANDSRLDAFFADSELLLTPTAPTSPHGHEGPGDRYSTALTWAFNLSGHPAISIPAGFDPDGCPVGLQLVAARGAEALLLRVAGVAEKHLGPLDR
ncbi:Asp-tRNAAsn/Glu-tRNAGln amidotransferase A subunit [Streptomyces sp. cf386]|uniref:amidase n=1 Tax=Streptomyces sp. cf386 TaxID=1761904 RepID=UPI0008857EF4|nr:amidase [Streptomyces sp. cf386]SDN08194.1 Asp-tRNAAsn/Glu-tRNAGln amidotransferase A subunit [Streptomyces sp. cf386]